MHPRTLYARRRFAARTPLAIACPIAAASVHIAARSGLGNLFRNQAATTQIASSITLALTLFRTLGAALITASAFIRTISSVLAATTVGAAVISRLTILYRTINGSTVLTSAISTTQSLRQITMAAVAIVTAGVHRLFFKRLGGRRLVTESGGGIELEGGGNLLTEDDGLCVIMAASLGKKYPLSLAAVMATVATLSRLLSLTRAVVVEAVLTPVIGRTLSLFRSLSAQCAFAANLAKGYMQTLAAATIESASLTRLLSLVRVLNPNAIFVPVIGVIATVLRDFFIAIEAAMVGVAQINRPLSLFRSIAAQMISGPGIVRAFYKAFRATTEFVSVLNFSGLLFVVMTAEAFLTAAATKIMGRTVDAVTVLAAETRRAVGKLVDAASIAAATYGRAIGLSLSAVVEFVGNVFTGGMRLIALTAEAIFVVGLSKLVGTTITAAMILSGSLYRGISRLLSAEISLASAYSRTIGIVIGASISCAAAFTKLLSIALSLAGAVTHLPVINRLGDFLDIRNFHMASRRITQFVRGRLHRKTSTTLPHTTNITRGGRMTGTKKRGSEDSDAD